MTNIAESRCLFCSLGCRFGIETGFGEALALDYTGGPLCSKGNFLLELINHPLRLTEPRVDGKVVPWSLALGEIASCIDDTGGRNTGIIIGADASVEDMLIARAFSDRCLDKSMLAVADATGDSRVYRAISEILDTATFASLADISTSKCLIAVGDPFEVGPVIAGRMLDAKYNLGRDLTFAVIADEPNRTTRFTSTRILGPIRKSMAALLKAVIALTGERAPSWAKASGSLTDIKDISGVTSLTSVLVDTPGAVLVLATQDPVVAALAVLIVEVIGKGAKLYPIFSDGNIAGIMDTGTADATINDIAAQSAQGDIETLIILGADLKRDPSHGALFDRPSRVIAAAPFANETTMTADIVLPAAVWLEYEGTWIGDSLQPVVSPPGGAKGYIDILRDIARAVHKPLEGQLPVKRPAGIGDTRDTVIARFLETLPETAGKVMEPPSFRSTVTCHGDGSLTGMMSWTAAMAREAW